MDKVDARYISFNSPEDILKEQERLMNLPVEEMLLEMKRLCLDSYDWQCFRDEFLSYEGYGKKSNVIISAEDYLGQEYISRGYAQQMHVNQNPQIRSNWEQINAMLQMRETFSKCAIMLVYASDKEEVAIKYNEFMGRYIDPCRKDRSKIEELTKDFSIDEAFAELRDIVNNIKRFYGNEDKEMLPEEEVMNLLEQYKPKLVSIVTGVESVEETYTDEYSDITMEVEYLFGELSESGEQDIPVLESPFFNKIEIIRDPEKEKTESRVPHEESKVTQTSESTVETQDTEKSIKAQKLAEFMKTQGLTQSDILELLTTLGRDGMRIEAEQQVVNIAESERSGKTNENEGVNR